MLADGSLTVKGGLQDSGNWWFEQDELCVRLDRLGRMRHIVLLKGKALRFFNLDGTLDFQLTLISG